jgi:hypothetical protein
VAGYAGTVPPQPVHQRVLSVIHNPLTDRSRGTRLSQHMRWFDPDQLASEYMRDVSQASHGLLRYSLAERIEVDGFAVKADGFRYDVETYLRCWRNGGGFHQPDDVDYHALLAEVGAVEKINSGQIDEVWLFGFPYSGYYESRMVGPGAFWCNAPPLEDRGRTVTLPASNRRWVVMGFNYEREVGCMLEDLGHRTESIMSQVYAGKRGAANLWERFSRYDQTAPGRASVGNVHFAPNSRADYDWGNPRPVMSDCDDWLRFPNLSGEQRRVTCREWGDGDMRRHHIWWFERIPHVDGETDGVLNNWWAYIADPNLVD